MSESAASAQQVNHPGGTYHDKWYVVKRILSESGLDSDTSVYLRKDMHWYSTLTPADYFDSEAEATQALARANP